MIRKAEKGDARALAELALNLWEGSVDGEEREFDRLINDRDAVIFMLYSDEKPAGFAQCQLRYDYVEGTDSSPVGYLEGIYVMDEYRRKGYAGKLLGECEKWARERGCREFASDCELDNDVSLAFHTSMGFEEANRIICFTKKLT